MRFSPASLAIMRPTCVLPVKLILRTAGCLMSAVVTAEASSGCDWMMFRTPSGRPASLNTAAMTLNERGANSGALRTAVLPAAMA